MVLCVSTQAILAAHADNDFESGGDVSGQSFGTGVRGGEGRWSRVGEEGLEVWLWEVCGS